MTTRNHPEAEIEPQLPFEYPLSTALKIYVARARVVLLVQAFVLTAALVFSVVAWSIYTNGLLGILGMIAGALLGLLGDAARRRAIARRARTCWRGAWGDNLADRDLAGGAHGHRVG